MFKKLVLLPRKTKIVLLVIIDIFLSFVAHYMSVFLRYEKLFLLNFEQIKPFLLALSLYLIIFFYSGIYGNINRVNNSKYFSKLISIFLIYGVIYFTLLFIIKFENFPRSSGIIQPIIFFVFTVITRIFYLFLISENLKNTNSNSTIIIFTNLDFIINNNYSSSVSSNNICAYIDFTNKNIDRRINNIKIVGLSELEQIIDKYDISNLIIQDESLNEKDKIKIFNKIKDKHIRFKFIKKLKNFSEQDETSKLDINLFLKRNINKKTGELNTQIVNKNILVTGAGGSIGQELCNQLALFNPSNLILLDHSEYNLYNVIKKLKKIQIKENFKTKIIPILGCIKDISVLNNIFKKYSPEKVFHSAAYKHVNIVEKNHIEALKNNFFGTINLLELCEKFKTKNFVLISTDKSVNPRSSMGATKRLAEMALECYAGFTNHTIYSAVRFGNVIDSSGSVIPLFREQIKYGGPITVTHPDVKRYFMLISEAVSLVLNADYLSKGGEIFTLNMGDQHKILDLAKLMIRSSGLLLKDNNYPNGDVEIKYIGLSKGEKLEEELNYESNKLMQTDNPNIFKTKTNPININEFKKILKKIEMFCDEGKEDQIIDIYKKNIEGFNIN